MRTPSLVVLLLCACAPTGAGEAETRRDAVLMGIADTATDAVFMLDLRYSNGRAAICSATLVSSKVLLTAAHCIDPSREGAASLTVSATNKPDNSNLRTTDLIAVTQMASHPRYAGAGTTDLAMLLLASAPAGVTAKALLRTPPPAFSDQSLRLVGYGRTSAAATDSATRRSAVVTISEATSNELKFGTAGMTGICSGDSGGPGLLTTGGVERVAGVHSYVVSPECGIGSDIRVDANLGFIDGFISTYDPARCLSDGRCDSSCSLPDPDCNVPAPPSSALDGGPAPGPGDESPARGGCSSAGAPALNAASLVLANVLRRRRAAR